MSKIQLTDTTPEMLFKLSEGNPGAVGVLIRLLKENATIDPDSALAEFGTIFSLDDMEIYGSNIWVLYKNVCKQDLINLVALFRGHQLGIVSSTSIIESTKTYNSFDFKDIISKIRERLPDFACVEKLTKNEF